MLWLAVIVPRVTLHQPSKRPLAFGNKKYIFRSMQPCMQGLPLVQLKNGGVLFVGVDGSDVQKKKN